MWSVCPNSEAFRITSGKGQGREAGDRSGIMEGSVQHTKGFIRWHEATDDI